MQSSGSKIAFAQHRMLRIRNSEVHPHKDGGFFIRIAGFKYDDFNRAGIVDIAKVDRLAQTLRIDTVKDSRLLIFAVGRRWTFSRRLYERAAIDFSMTLHSVLGGVGRSTFDVHQSFNEDDHSSTAVDDDGSAAVRERLQPLAVVRSRAINVDPVTRRIVSWPDDVHETLLRQSTIAGDGEQLSPYPPKPKIPDESFSCGVRVRYDDMDALFHTNAASYLGFALESAAQAAESRFYSAIRGDVAFYRAKSVTSVYTGESQAGDDLTVSTWEDGDNKMLLNFAITKLNKIIYSAQIEYYEYVTGLVPASGL